MAERVTKDLAPEDWNGYLTITLPIRTLQRLHEYANRRQRSAFVRAALERALEEADAAALDQAEQDYERAAV